LKLTFSFFIIFISFISQAQDFLSKAAKDSDAVIISHKEIAINQILKIDFIELLDTTCFKNYPLPPASVSFIRHSCIYNSAGYCEHYNWSFSESDSIQINEPDASSGHFFIPNEYDFVYEGNNLKNIHVSDISHIKDVVYLYDNDSIYLNFSFFLNNGLLSEKKIAYNKSILISKYIISHTGIKKYYYPKFQILNLKMVHDGIIFINGIPVSSFMNDKFEQKRFFFEVHPGLFIFFEIVE
jgi:hypothetical protein